MLALRQLCYNNLPVLIILASFQTEESSYERVDKTKNTVVELSKNKQHLPFYWGTDCRSPAFSAVNEGVLFLMPRPQLIKGRLKFFSKKSF